MEHTTHGRHEKCTQNVNHRNQGDSGTNGMINIRYHPLRNMWEWIIFNWLRMASNC